MRGRPRNRLPRPWKSRSGQNLHVMFEQQAEDHLHWNCFNPQFEYMNFMYSLRQSYQKGFLLLLFVEIIVWRWQVSCGWHFYVAFSFQIILATLYFFFQIKSTSMTLAAVISLRVRSKNAQGVALEQQMRRFQLISSFSLPQKPRSIKIAKYWIENAISLKTKTWWGDSCSNHG